VRYQVVWNDHAIELLQRIYDGTDDKEGLIHTVTRIGLELGAEPTEAGESRDPGQRILFKYPLVVWFRLDEDQGDVVIFDVKPSRKR
jgi:hypothetical protein